MSRPSDVTPDIAEAAERLDQPLPRSVERGVSQFTPEQRGWALTALVAFVGVAFVGPAVHRALNSKRSPPKRSTRDQLTRHAGYVRGRAMKASGRARKRIRRLGGGSFAR